MPRSVTCIMILLVSVSLLFQGCGLRRYNLDRDVLRPVDSIEYRIHSEYKEYLWMDTYAIEDPAAMEKFIRFLEGFPSNWRQRMIMETVPPLPLAGDGKRGEVTTFRFALSAAGDEKLWIAVTGLYGSRYHTYVYNQLTEEEQKEAMDLLGIREEDLRRGRYKILPPARRKK